MKFEDSLKKLEEISDKIRDDNTSLDDALQFYEEGMKAYKECAEMLENAKQKIEVINK